MYDDFKELVGKTVLDIFMDDDTFVQFNTDNGNFAYGAESDCCSQSWIEHFEGVNNVIGSEISKVEEIDIDDPVEGKNDNIDEYLTVYGIRITTAKGIGIFEYRNASNGYYGGWMQGTSPSEQTNDMKRIIEDF